MWKITVTMLNGMSKEIDVSPEDTVGSLKLRIQNATGVPVENQKLVIVNGSKIDLSDNTKPVSYYGMESNSRVSLLQVTPPQVTPETFQVFVRNDKGKTIPYDVRPTDTVGNFRERVSEREQIPLSQMNLSFEGRNLGQDGKTLKDYGVKLHSTIDLMLRLRGGRQL